MSHKFLSFPQLLSQSGMNIKIYNRPKLSGEDWMICSDVHAPFHSEVWLDKYLAIARKLGIKRQIIVGDLFEFGVFSSFQPVEGEQELGATDEILACREVIKKFSDYFKETYLVSGNHERRLFRWTDGKLPAMIIYSLFPEMKENFYFTFMDMVEIGSSWAAVHPKSYSQISGNVAFRLASKFHRNIINAHGHFTALRYDISGKYVVIDSGGLFDTKKIDYINLQTTTHPFWNNGFVALRGGYPFLFHEKTDFNYFLKTNRARGL